MHLNPVLQVQKDQNFKKISEIQSTLLKKMNMKWITLATKT